MKKTRLFWSAVCAIPLCVAAASVSADQYTEGYDLAVDGDYRTAFAKWLPAAVDGDGRAQFNLALMYHGGVHVAANERIAVHWYRKAAHNGIREAQQYMYVGYKEGWFGLPRDDNRAAYWAKQLERRSL